jgi:hypothetical protein
VKELKFEEGSGDLCRDICFRGTLQPRDAARTNIYNILPVGDWSNSVY